jgi:hypothetical protein
VRDVCEPAPHLPQLPGRNCLSLLVVLQVLRARPPTTTGIAHPHSLVTGTIGTYSNRSPAPSDMQMILQKMHAATGIARGAAL